MRVGDALTGTIIGSTIFFFENIGSTSWFALAWGKIVSELEEKEKEKRKTSS